MRKFAAALGLLSFFAQYSFGDSLKIDPEFHHIRNAEPREWSHYPEKPGRQRLEIQFDLENPGKYIVLTFRQKGTKQTWKASLNGQSIGSLIRDHNHFESGFDIPEGLLKEKENTLEIYSESSVPDDIEVGDIALWTTRFEIDPETSDRLRKNRGYHRSLPDLSGKLTMRAIDKSSNKALPCRFTVVDQETGALAFIGAESDDRIAVREGVIYSLDGEATVFVDPGKRFRIYCGRGFEYSLASVDIANIKEETVDLAIEREVDTPGLAACDTHLHTFEFDRHGDCTLTERLISAAGEGVEIPVSTAHDKHINYAAEAKRIGADRWFTSIAGCEVTTSLGHFNSFPVRPDAPTAVHKLRDWDRIFTNIFATPEVKICVLNHGRDVHRKFTPLAPDNFDADRGTFLHGRKLLANAMEVINSGATQTDPMQLVDDWFALLLSGHKIAAVGSSDSHTVNFAIPGQGRTYLQVPDDSDPSKLDATAAIESILSGQTWVSFGLLTTLELSGNKIDISVLGPSWTEVNRVRVFRNRELVSDIEVENSSRGGVKFTTTLSTPLQKGDFVCAVATGPGIADPWWPMMPPYQPDSPVLERYVFGMSPAVWVK
ncbi:MAG: CehA/McbA family metallohydrolase [Verrucomicrobiales bacterium]|nr:CehA/McbA family metallohydrolase [Verrucomicrobiales bacterium]